MRSSASIRLLPLFPALLANIPLLGSTEGQQSQVHPWSHRRRLYIYTRSRVSPLTLLCLQGCAWHAGQLGTGENFVSHYCAGGGDRHDIPNFWIRSPRHK